MGGPWAPSSGRGDEEDGDESECEKGVEMTPLHYEGRVRDGVCEL